MINLLPPKEKEELLLQKYKRLVVVLGNMVLISVVCLTLILFALKFYVLSEISFQKLNLDLANQKYTTDGTMTFKEMIKKYNASLMKMNDFYKHTTYMSDILKNALGVNRAPGIYFKDISINRLRKDSASSGSDEVKISITGYSSTRESLILFKEALEKNDKIKNISFPPQNWIKDSDIDFEVKFEKK